MSERNRVLSIVLFAASLAVLAGAAGLIAGSRTSDDMGLDRLADAMVGLVAGLLLGGAFGVVVARELSPGRLRAATIVLTLLAGALVAYVATALRY